MKRLMSQGWMLWCALAGVFALGACDEGRNRVDPGISPVSGALALSADDRLLVIAAEDHDQVLVLERATRTLLHRVPVSAGPGQLVLHGSVAVVSARRGHRLDIVDVVAGRRLRSIEVGTEPCGLAVLRDGSVAVALAGEQALALVDVDAGRVLRKIPLPALDPRAVAQVADGRVLVTHMASGQVSEVDLASSSTRLRDVATANAFGPRMEAEHLRSLTLSPDGRQVLMAHSQASTDPVRAPLLGAAGDGAEGAPLFDEDVPLGGENCGYSGCASELPAVSPAVTVFDVPTGLVIVPEPGPAPGAVDDRGSDPVEPTPAARPSCPDCGAVGFLVPNPPSVLNPNEMRFAGVPLNNPVALALFDGGRGQAVLHLGSRNVLLLRRELRGQPDDVLGVIPVGHGATAIVLTHGGDLAYVWNQFDGSVTEFEVPLVRDAQGASRFAGEPDVMIIEEGQAKMQMIPSESFLVVEDALPALASQGRKLFHDALDPRIAAAGSISCASCHPEGRADGRTWKFTFGPRNTPQLGGGILDTAPFHWPGDVETVDSLNEMTIRAFMGGQGLDAQGMQAIGAFIDLIPKAPSVADRTQTLSESAARGKAIFEDDRVGCTSCHLGEDFTDNLSWDVGTKAFGDERMLDIAAFQTPVLHGLHRSAPYLHDGSAHTLEELVETLVRTDQMGQGSHLSDDEAADLVSYLQSL